MNVKKGQQVFISRIYKAWRTDALPEEYGIYTVTSSTKNGIFTKKLICKEGYGKDRLKFDGNSNSVDYDSDKFNCFETREAMEQFIVNCKINLAKEVKKRILRKVDSLSLDIVEQLYDELHDTPLKEFVMKSLEEKLEECDQSLDFISNLEYLLY